MLNDRIVIRLLQNTVGELIRSESPWSSLLLWIGALALSVLPATFVGTFASVSRTRIWLIATVVAFTVYSAIAFSCGRLLLHHRDFIFFHACRTVCASVLAVSLAYTCFAVASTKLTYRRLNAQRGEPSDAPKDRASCFGNGKSTAGPR